MEWPSIWECREVFLALMKLAREKPFHDSSMSEDEQLHALNDSSGVQAKLQDRLSILEYCCYTIRRVATNLDAFARAKAAPKTKSYALDADATEDPTVHRIPETGDDNSFQDAPEDMLDGHIDVHVPLKPGEAPEKVHHPLTADARLSLQKFEKQPACMFVKQRTAKQLEELCEVRRLASKLPTLSKDMLDEQRAAFEASVTSTDDAQACAEPNEKAVETHRLTLNRRIHKHNGNMSNSHMHVLLQGFNNLKPLRMIPIQIEGASSWLTSSGPFANGSDMLSMSHLTKRSDKCP